MEPPVVLEKAASTKRVPSLRRFALAMFLGAVVDGLQLLAVGMPPVTWALDIVAVAGFFAIYGFRPLLLIPLAVELVPGLALAPTWFVAAGVLHATANTVSAPSTTEPR